ncbi:MAG: NarL family two-component response regulator, partial [Chloroflexi bacterium]|nr:NarL family two-component response regulator [Chloroflexota bacterium]
SNAMLFAEDASRARLATLRTTIGEALRDTRDPDALLHRAVASIGQTLDSSWCSVYLCEGGTPPLRGATFDRDDASLDKRIEAVLQSILALVTQHPRTIAVADVSAEPSSEVAIRANSELLLAGGVHSLVIAPMLLNSEVVGALLLLQTGKPRMWASGEVMLLEQVAVDLALALAQSKAYATLDRQSRQTALDRDALASAIFQSTDGIIIADVPPHRLRYWNSAAASMAAKGTPMASTGPAEPLDFDPYTLDGKPYPIDEWPLSRAFREGSIVTAEESLLRRRDGSFMTVHVSAAPTSDAQGRTSGALAIIHDISLQRLAEGRAAQRDVQIQGLNHLLEALASSSDLQQALAEQLPKLLPFDAVALHFDGDTGAQLSHFSGSAVAKNGSQDDDMVQALQHIIGQAVGQDGVLLLDDVSRTATDNGWGTLSRYGLRSAILAPIVVDNHTTGALGFFDRRPAAYSERDSLVVSQFALLLGLVLNHQRLLRETQHVATRDERDRLARELHDILAQTITSVVLQLETVLRAIPEDTEHRDALEQARTMARSAVAETRRVVWNLRSSTVNLQEPRSVVAEEGAKLERRIGIKPEIITTGEERLLAPEVGAVVQRFARVALDNIWTHSEAKHVRILLDFGLHVFTLLIEDDGKGFDPDEVDLLSAGRVGLAGVGERARVIGGSLRIESAANQGTRVWGIVPYSPTAPVPKAKPVATGLASAAVATTDGDITKRIRVVLIDDHSMVREGLERMLSDHPDLQVVGAAATGSDGLRIINELHPDVVLCDLQLPDISGVEVISRVRTLFPDIRCVIVTTFDHDDFIYEGIKSGAKGYVLKDVSSTELAEAVRAAARNESLLQTVVAGKLLERFGEMARQGDMVEPLTEREIGVLRALATGSRNKEIALQLSLSESTIKTHLASIFGKLGVTTRTEAVTRGRELGLIPL